MDLLAPIEPLTPRQRTIAWTLAIVCAASRFLAMARTLWDWDEALFCLGMRSYDVACTIRIRPGFRSSSRSARSCGLVVHDDFRSLQAVNLVVGGRCSSRRCCCSRASCGSGSRRRRSPRRSAPSFRTSGSSAGRRSATSRRCPRHLRGGDPHPRLPRRRGVFARNRAAGARDRHPAAEPSRRVLAGPRRDVLPLEGDLARRRLGRRHRHRHRRSGVFLGDDRDRLVRPVCLARSARTPTTSPNRLLAESGASRRSGGSSTASSSNSTSRRCSSIVTSFFVVVSAIGAIR